MKSPSMTNVLTQDKIQAAVSFIASTLDIPEDTLGPESSMDNTPAWDSSEHMNICLLFEQKFGVPMNMDIITSATSIRALAALIP
jgi:acyl carrier protein